MQDKEIIRNLTAIIIYNLPDLVMGSHREELEKLFTVLSNTDQSKLVPLNGSAAMKLGIIEMTEYLNQAQ